MAAEHSASGGEGCTETAAPAEIAGELSAKMIAHARQSFEIASPLPLRARRERTLLAGSASSKDARSIIGVVFF